SRAPREPDRAGVAAPVEGQDEERADDGRRPRVLRPPAEQPRQTPPQKGEQPVALHELEPRQRQEDLRVEDLGEGAPAPGGRSVVQKPVVRELPDEEVEVPRRQGGPEPLLVQPEDVVERRPAVEPVAQEETGLAELE